MAWFSKDGVCVSIARHPDVLVCATVFGHRTETAPHTGWTVNDFLFVKTHKTDPCEITFEVACRVTQQLSITVLSAYPFLRTIGVHHVSQERLARHMICHSAIAFGCTLRWQMDAVRRILMWDLVIDNSRVLTAICPRQWGKSVAFATCVAAIAFYSRPKPVAILSNPGQTTSSAVDANTRLYRIFHGDNTKNSTQLETIAKEIVKMSENTNIPIVIDKQSLETFRFKVVHDGITMTVRIQCGRIEGSRGVADDGYFADEILLTTGPKLQTNLWPPIFNVPGRFGLFITSPPFIADSMLLAMTREGIPNESIPIHMATVCNSIACNQSVTTSLACRHAVVNLSPWLTEDGINNMGKTEPRTFAREMRGYCGGITTSGISTDFLTALTVSRTSPTVGTTKFKYIIASLDTDQGGPDSLGFTMIASEELPLADRLMNPFHQKYTVSSIVNACSPLQQPRLRASVMQELQFCR